MATVVISSPNAQGEHIAKVFGTTLTVKNSRVLSRMFRSIIRIDPKARYIAAAMKEGQAEVTTLHDEIALANFINRVTKRYDELTVLDLTNAKREMITENLH